MGRTISEKILGRAAGREVEAGEFVECAVDMAMAHDGTSVIALKVLSEMGVDKVWDPTKIAIPFDHIVPANCERTARLHRMVREWVRTQGIPHFFDVGEGICHQLLPEKGLVRPGMLVVGADSHTCTYGALGAFATGLGATDIADVFARGITWLRVPETIRVEVNGALPDGVMAKDVVLSIVGTLGADGASYRAIEYYGDTISSMPMDGRLTLCNMGVEMGAKASIVPPDAATIEYVGDKSCTPVHSDEDANFCERHVFDVSHLAPQVAVPHRVDDVHPVEDVAGEPVDQVLIGTCTNGRLSDLEAAATILKGKKVKVRTIIAPASRQILLEATRKGITTTLLESGATVINPGCGPCLGAHEGVLSEGEVCLSTANRNFKGRMGAGGLIYLASPLTAAATALRGEITDAREFL
ncbi:MAG: 3-isopropylmalate dehydratase large subunit [Methermicoccaceae archaeon]